MADGKSVGRVCAWLGAVALAASVIGSQSSWPVSAAGTGYVSLPSSARILDTRADGVTADAQGAAGGIVAGGQTVEMVVAGRVGVPSDAISAMLNVTVTGALGAGYVTVHPCGAARPIASNLNFVAGQTIANLVAASIGSHVCLFASAATHLVVDVAGYFPGTDVLTPLAPARLLDTRSDGVTVDGAAMGQGARPAGSVQVLQVTNRAAVPGAAASVVLNVTVDQPLGPGFITVYPCGALPTASNVNFAAGQTIANFVAARVSAAGTVCLYTSSTTHLVVDVAGYIVDTGVIVPLPAPARLLDTRSDGSTIDDQFEGGGLRPAGGTIALSVGGRASIPAAASAVLLNVTADQAQSAGVVTVYPTGVGRPNASNLNYAPGQAISNAVVAHLGADGDVCLFTSGATHLVVDVSSYIIGPAAAATGGACPTDPSPPLPPPPPAATSATDPALQRGASPILYPQDVASTVTLAAPGVVELITSAYRHPPTVRARITATEPGTIQIVTPCRYTRLDMTWTVSVDGVDLESSTLNCM